MSHPFEQDDLVDQLHTTLDDLPDHRTGDNIQYSIKDAALGAFGTFFTQTPSFLAYQRHLERRKGRSNAETLLRMEKVPCDTHIRELLDPQKPARLSGLFIDIADQFRNTDIGQDFQVLDGHWLVGLDGTQTFSSTRISCGQCHHTEPEEGPTRYSHQMVNAVLVSPKHNRVLSLPPEFVEPQPDQDRQDCELEAGKRWIKQHAALFEEDAVTLLGDDLYANQPTCQLALAHDCDFIFVCKPGSHAYLYEELAGLDRLDDGLPTLTQQRWNGRFYEIWTYRYINAVPIRAGEGALRVNWVEVTITHARTREELYHCAFITNHPLSEDTAPAIVRAGRARWKNENEHNNVLKNRGYHLEHNFGHGDQHLSNFLVTLNLLAFVFHTLFDLFDATYQQIREALGARRIFFNDLRALTRYWVFDSWEHLLDFMLEGLEIAGPRSPTATSG